MEAARKTKKRLIDAATMLMVSGFSLVLLIYIGYGEAQRTFQQFHLEKLVAQGRVVQSAVESFLRPGLPLRQFVGFTSVTEPILSSDAAIAAMTVFDRSDKHVFGSGDKRLGLLRQVIEANDFASETFELRESELHYQVVLPLRNKFERVGSLAITMPRAIVSDRVRSSFEPLLYVAAFLSIMFTIFVTLGTVNFGSRRMSWRQLAYAITFVVMAGFVIGTLVTLYSEGAQAKSKALADTLGQRLADVIRFNLNINELDGLDRAFDSFQRLNPDISAAALTINGGVQIHTDPEQVGTRWMTSPGNYEYVVHLTPEGSARDIRVAVALPSDVVYRQILRSVKNFAALFVASAFLAGLFLQLAGSVQRSQNRGGSREEASSDDDAALSLVKPVFFVAIFLEHLNYAFLPQFMYQVVEASGFNEAYASAPFMAYYLCFALSLIPAGYFAQNHNARPLMYIGLLAAGAGLLIMTFPPDLFLVVFGRALSGIGQGMLFIGVQSYILTMASPGKKTRGAAIIVFGFQGGMISGMAVGSLLVNYLGPTGIFTLSGVIAYLMAVYALIAVPVAAQKGTTGIRVGFTFGQLAANLGSVLRSMEFLRAMLLIGIPAKAVLTGVVIFALPVLLAQMNYRQEDIGQIIMIYAAAVVIASGYVSRLVDRTGQTHSVLFLGALISGLGLFMIGMLEWSAIGSEFANSTAATLILVSGVAIVGIAHGFINAPVVTHVADLDLASKVGASSLTATYRFLERLGHIAGPIIVAQLFIFGGQSMELLIWIGMGVAILGFLFILPVASNPGNTAKTEMIR